MNLRRGSTSSPMSMLKIWSARTLSSTWHCLRNRVFGFMVVSFSCYGDISPRPLNRVIATFFLSSISAMTLSFSFSSNK